MALRVLRMQLRYFDEGSSEDNVETKLVDNESLEKEENGKRNEQGGNKIPLPIE